MQLDAHTLEPLRPQPRIGTWVELVPGGRDGHAEHGHPTIRFPVGTKAPTHALAGLVKAKRIPGAVTLHRHEQYREDQAQVKERQPGQEAPPRAFTVCPYHRYSYSGH